jgi:uncharacterized protein with NRDE domain
VCLLVVAFQLLPGTPLLIGANRDEFLNRPAVPMTVLQAEAPRILGGLDKQSGGTWLAVNEWGVFAGLTNQPREGGRNASRRTRGELPLAITAHATAQRGVEAFLAHHRPSDYNGSWMLAGDRDSLYYIDFTGMVAPEAVALAPGLHVLENRPLSASSPKAERVAAALATLEDVDTALIAFRRVLSDHTMAESGDQVDVESAKNREGPDHRVKPRSSANCVHLNDDNYGTRSSCLIRGEANPASPPQIWVADGPPCTAPFVDASGLWAPEDDTQMTT